ncbi:hypothetical protein NOR_00746 [Metarhizium rileyi]|uniref:Peptidase M43 pregnancy-associated plasma-A domain-containing protein n=1 Tax=Metarhizium rileyi (strain RCEF 4871) TaxID=1649241 RepID=A0A167JI64_METRR|nr:hypothetical protein NOR_00746 [Metarhizium rileyi RCEF 4871]
MIPSLRFIVSGLLVSAACTQALDAANVTKHKKHKCGGPKPSQGLPVLDLIGDTASIVGHTPNITGHSPNATSHLPDIIAQTDNVTTHKDDITVQADNITGQTGDVTGQTGSIAGQTDSITSKTGNITGQTDNVTGQTGSIAGQTDSITSKTGNVTGQTDNVTGQTDNASNATIVRCGTPRLSKQEQTELKESLGSVHNITKRQGQQQFNIPTYVTVVAKDHTMEGGYLSETQIQNKLDEVRELWSFGFHLDDSVDRVQHYVRPDLFQDTTGFLNKDALELLGEFHRGPRDYASLNIIFVFRLADRHTLQEFPDGGYTFSSAGVDGKASIPTRKIWENHDGWEKFEAEDGIVISSATIEKVAHGRALNVKRTLSHELGHWLGLLHTDSEVTASGVRVKSVPDENDCDMINDGFSDTPTHILSQEARNVWEQCPKNPGERSIPPVFTCTRMDNRPDPIFNLMVSISYGNCPVHGLTNQQQRRALETYSEIRLPFKEEMQKIGITVGSRQQANNQAQTQPNRHHQTNNQRRPQSKWHQQWNHQPQSNWNQQANNQGRPQSNWNQQANNQRRPQSKWHQQWNHQPQSNWNQWNAQNAQNARNSQREGCLGQARADFDYRVQEALYHKYNELRANYDSISQQAGQYSYNPQYHRWVAETINNAADDFHRQWNHFKDDRASHWEPFRQLHRTEQSRC